MYLPKEKLYSNTGKSTIIFIYPVFYNNNSHLVFFSCFRENYDIQHKVLEIINIHYIYSVLYKCQILIIPIKVLILINPCKVIQSMFGKNKKI